MKRDLTLQPEQAAVVRALIHGLNEAQERLAIAFQMVGIREASNPSLTGNVLTVQVPDEAA